MSDSRCNFCGKPLDLCDEYADFSVDRLIGYGSKHDGEWMHVRLCCACFDRIVDKLNQACEAPILQWGDNMQESFI